MKTLVFTTLASLWFGTTACVSPEDAELVFEEDGGKADVVRPFGYFALVGTEWAFTRFEWLRLAEDRTFEGATVSDCNEGSCIHDVAGKFRFASSNGKPYIVSYVNDMKWFSFEYKLDGDSLKLREAKQDNWFTMGKVPEGLHLDQDDNGGTFDATDGDQIKLSLPAKGTTGHDWYITSTDRSFGYGTTSYTRHWSGDHIKHFTWQTSQNPLPQIGEHTVKLEHKTSETDTSPIDTFEFTVVVGASE